MTVLYLVRHGETSWNHEGRVQGHSNPPLNELGIRQARNLAQRLAAIHFDAAYASDSQRAIQTASSILRERPVDLAIREALRERFLGRWEGLLASEIARAEPANWDAWQSRPYDWAPHGGETEQELERRVVGEIASIVDNHLERTLLIVSHGGSMRATLRAWLGVEQPEIPNCGTFVVEVVENQHRLIDVFGPTTDYC